MCQVGCFLYYAYFLSPIFAEIPTYPKIGRPLWTFPLALSEAMSNSSSPRGTVEHPPPGEGGGQHPLLTPRGSPIPGSNLVVRPKPARSPDEWMKRPENGINNSKLSKEGEIFWPITNTFDLHCVAKVYAVLPFYDVKCLCSGGREWGREESHSH